MKLDQQISIEGRSLLNEKIRRMREKGKVVRVEETYVTCGRYLYERARVRVNDRVAFWWRFANLSNSEWVHSGWVRKADRIKV